MRGIGGVIEPNGPIPGSIGWAYQRVTALRGMERENSGTPLTAHESKWRDWPRAWKHPAIFADCDPKTIAAEQLLAMRARVAGAIGATDAFKLIKTWGGALWKKWPPWGSARRMGRQETWREGEVVRLVKQAIRMKYPGLASFLLSTNATLPQQRTNDLRTKV
jgi:hypothetical protein